MNTETKEQDNDLDFPDLDFQEIEAIENKVADKDTNEAEKATDTKEATTESTPEFTEVEQEAFAQGWRPKEEFVKNGGDPKSWRPADWWMDRGELLNQNRQTAKELREIKQAFVRMSQANADAYLKGKQDAIRVLKEDRKKAILDGNTEIALDLEDKIEKEQDELAAARQQTQTQQVNKQAAGPSQEYLSWLNQNQWYQQDEDLHHMANSWMQVFVQYNPNATHNEALTELTRYIRKARPDKFGSGPRVTQPQAEGRGKSTKSGDSSGNSVNERLKKILGDMDPISRRIASDMIKSGDMSKEEYVKLYDR